MTPTEIKLLEGRELDVAVAERVMGWPHIGPNDPYRPFREKYGGIICEGVPRNFLEIGVIPDDWHPSTDHNAAAAVLEEIEKRGLPTINRFVPQLIQLIKDDPSGHTTEDLSYGIEWGLVTATSAEICKAAILCVENRG